MSSESENPSLNGNRPNRTFARRIGKRLSDYNKDLLQNVLPKHQYCLELLPDSLKRKTFLEIGFGMGEHLFEQVKANSENLYIGVEVYLNGVANLLKLAGKEDCNNFLIWPNDLDMILNDIPDKCLDGIYILFPDPWHKRRYLKKRLVNAERMKLLKSKMKIGGFIAFASDIEDYFEDVKKMFIDDVDLAIQNTDPLAPHAGYHPTKYHQKAIRENRVPRFIQAVLQR